MPCYKVCLTTAVPARFSDALYQNLGEEGTAYVVEALAFNTTCQGVDLSKNGISKMGIAALCQVELNSTPLLLLKTA
jgi:hypothetical protein